MDKNQLRNRAMQIQVGLLAGGTGVLADLILQQGWQGLIVAGGATAALVYFAPEYVDDLREKAKRAIDAIDEVKTAVPYALRLRPAIDISDEAIEAHMQDMGMVAQEVDEEPEIEEGHRDIPANWINDIEDGVGSFGESEKSDVFFFSDLLKTDWRPSWNEIFVGQTIDGKSIFVPALDLCHVAFAGKTGGGKGSLMRLIMVQLCYIGAPVALLNPHYMRWIVAKEGPDFDEDWSPFEGINPHTNKPYLEKSPLVCTEMPMIDSCLTRAVETLLESRKKRARTQKVNFVPYFIVIDEWPLIVRRLGKRAPELLGYLLREGRKYRIYVIIASQDFQVKTLGCEGEGSMRKSLLTVFYAGGDMTTRCELLNEETRETPENKIGKGVVLMRCTSTQNEVVLARVPFVNNESVYLLLGPSTYQDGRDTDELEELTTVTVSSQNGLPEHENGDRKAYGYGRNDEPETASEEAVRGQNEAVVTVHMPDGWTEKKAALVPGLYRVFGDLDDCLKGLEFSTSQKNRDFARGILKQHGLWKEK